MTFVSWNDAIDAFDAELDSDMTVIRVAGIRFMPSNVLRECDPIAYRCYLMDFIDANGVDSDHLSNDGHHRIP